MANTGVAGMPDELMAYFNALANAGMRYFISSCQGDEETLRLVAEAVAHPRPTKLNVCVSGSQKTGPVKCGRLSSVRGAPQGHGAVMGTWRACHHQIPPLR